MSSYTSRRTYGVADLVVPFLALANPAGRAVVAELGGEWDDRRTRRYLRAGVRDTTRRAAAWAGRTVDTSARAVSRARRALGAVLYAAADLAYRLANGLFDLAMRVDPPRDVVTARVAGDVRAADPAPVVVGPISLPVPDGWPSVDADADQCAAADRWDRAVGEALAAVELITPDPERPASAELAAVRAGTGPAELATVRTFADGSRVLEWDGVRITTGQGAGVLALSDWGRADDLVRAGVLVREVWRGDGTAGHDTYRLADPAPAPTAAADVPAEAPAPAKPTRKPRARRPKAAPVAPAAESTPEPAAAPERRKLRVRLSRDDGPGRRSGAVLGDDGAVIGDASDYIYGGRGFAVHTKPFAGFVPLDDIEFVTGPAAESAPAVPSDPPAADPAPAPAPELAADPAPVRPARKPRTRKPKAAPVMPSAARETAPPAAESAPTVDAPAVHTADVRPLTLAKLVADHPGRFGAIATVRAGWATNAKVLVPVPDADREALVAQLKTAGADDGGRPVPAREIFPKSIDPRPFVFVGRKWDDGREPVAVLRREDGRTEYADLRLYLTLVKHCPGCVLVQGAGAGRNSPLVAWLPEEGVGYTGRPCGVGMLMPLVWSEEVGARAPDWSPDDVALTLTHKAGSQTLRATLTRGHWRAVLAQADGTESDPERFAVALRDVLPSFSGPADPPVSTAEVRRVAHLVALAGRAAVARLLGVAEPAAEPAAA